LAWWFSTHFLPIGSCPSTWVFVPVCGKSFAAE
jgi:hypothetical protein